MNNNENSDISLDLLKEAMKDIYNPNYKVENCFDIEKARSALKEIMPYEIKGCSQVVQGT